MCWRPALRRIGASLGLPATAILLHAVGQELVQQGKLAAALAHYGDSLERLPPTHPHVASTRTALGQLLTRVGRHADAIDHLQEALRLKSAVFNQGHPYVAYSLVALGEALFAGERHAEALDALGRALPVLERRAGALSPRTLACHLFLGRTHTALGNADAARSHIDRVLASANFGLGDPRLLGLARWSLGQLEHLQGRPTEALARFRRAVTELEPLLGAHHPDFLALLHDYGRALHRAGDHEGALVAFGRCLEGHRANTSTETQAAATIINALGQAHYSLGRFPQALENYHQAFEIRQRCLGPDHPQTIISRFNCGTVMRQLGDPFGLAEMESAAERLEELLGADHPHVQMTRGWLR